MGKHNLKRPYPYLTFYCDWAVHSELAGTMAQKVLEAWDRANVHLRKGVELHDLPSGLRKEIDQISKLNYFEEELNQFLMDYELPSISERRHDGWTHFLHLYLQIIEECPLLMRATNGAATIDKVTVQFELANRVVEGEMMYKISWIVADKNGLTGELFIINSFSL